MAKDFSEIIKLIFPEYQIKEAINERGFIAKKQDNVNYAKTQEQTVRQNNFVQQTAPISQTKATSETYALEKKVEKVVNRASDVFDTLPDELGKYWVGSQNDKTGLCKSFQRPYVGGFDQIKPKNTILLLGSESRGKKYAVRCISSLLKQYKIFRYEEIAELDMQAYISDANNTLFISDLYKALNTNTESVVFDNIDKSTVAQLDIIYQLLSEGVYHLTKRYMDNNGSLVDGTGVLNTTMVSQISANGKFFVMASVLSQVKIMSVLGNKFISEMGDIIELDRIEENQTRDLAHTLTQKMIGKCKKYLHVDITFDESVVEALSSQYNEKAGIRGLEEYIEDYLYKSLSEMKLNDILWDDERAKLTYKTDYIVILKGGEEIPISRYIKNYDALRLQEVKKELDDVIGLKAVKEYVLNLETNLKVQKMRESKGLKKSDISMHMIFAGNPGTGKTTIARIVAKYLKAIGVLSSGHLCEVTRADLVGQYAGYTAVKTTEVINSAKGGVLFIDEAYSLCRDKNDIFGLEAIDALVKGMEDNREDLVVILAGYEDEMQEFLKSNTGLRSRFPNMVHFKDYTVEEMYAIAGVTAKAKGYRMSEDCKDGMIHAFKKKQIKGKNDSGNGRLVRNMIETAIIKQSKRISENPDADMELLTASDFGFDKIVEFNLEKSLDEIIGMDEVKNMIREQYNMLQANKKRKNAQYEVDTTQSLNMIFSGNPGTGKTTMARIVAEMFHSMDILKSGQLIETDKSGLVAGYVGQTAKKTEEVFKSALGGVLFIDEAYSITNDGSSFGQECIDTLVKLIEDYRGEIVVILAGYSKEMSEFMKSNSGLESRFPLRIDFPDYSAEELFEIGKQMIKGRGFTITDNALKLFEEEVRVLKNHANAASGNGRMIRNYIEDIIRRQSSRIATSDVNEKELTEITESDVKQNIYEADQFNLEQVFDKVIGLDNVKNYIRALNARLKLQEERKKAGLKTDNTQTMHMIFTGNPGTGKTMMARTVADVLYNMHVIKTNKLIETDRSGLVAGYVGQTAIKTREVIETALDGVLFIDEAYALAQGGENDFGQEAIDTLVKMMDDNRNRLVVILAGYSEDMQHFLEKNVGLQSRFANIIEFPDYTTDELMQIANGMYKEQGYALDASGEKELKAKLDAARNEKHFGNGRYVRNVFEKSLNNQALRLSRESNYTPESLTMITIDDVKGVF